MFRFDILALVAMCLLSLLEESFAILKDHEVSNMIFQTKKLSRKRYLRITSNAGHETQSNRGLIAREDDLELTLDTEFGRMLEMESYSMISSSMPLKGRSRFLKPSVVPNEEDTENYSSDAIQISYNEEFGRMLENGSLSLSYMGSI